MLRKRSTRVLALIVGLSLLTSLSVVGLSNAAFTATTTPGTQDLTAGVVELTDDSTTAVLLDVPAMVPSEVVSTCVNVTYTGTVEDGPTRVIGPVRHYFTGTGTTDLDSHLDVTVDEGTGATGDGDCSGFTLGTAGTATALDSARTARVDYASGGGTWDPSVSGESRSYRITYAMDAATPDSAQGLTSQVELTFETQTDVP